MRPLVGWGSWTRAIVGVTALAATVGACGSGLAPLSRPSPASLPAGSPLANQTLGVGDAWLRHYLLSGQPDTALALFAPDQEPPATDELLSALQRAILLRESGDLEESNHLLEWADQEAERRHTRSVSRTAGSFLISDRVLEYTPSLAEMAMIPFYRMTNYLALGDMAAAAVEARRIGALLGRRKPSVECSGAGMLDYLAGLTFESAGEIDDALVSLRQAEQSFAGCGESSGIGTPPGFGRDLTRVAGAAGFSSLVDSLAVRYPDAEADSAIAGQAELIVVLERGFVAHRTAGSVHVPILDEELEGWDDDDSDDVAFRASAIAARLLGNLAERQVWGSSWDDSPAVQVGQALSGAHILKLTWPSLAPPREEAPGIRLVAGEVAARPATVADLSRLAGEDLDRERPAILARLVARSVTKFLLSRELERRAEDQGGELLGFIAGRVANLAANEMERPDTRSWTLLPDEISVARIALSPGCQTVWIEAPRGDGDDAEEARRMGTFDLSPGERRIVAVRIFDRWSKAESNNQRGAPQ